MKKLSPTIGNWYKDLQTNQLFEVIDWDPSTRLIELQYLDGELTEYDLDGWEELRLLEVEAPEDWRTPYELDADDRLDPDLPAHPEDWNNPLSAIEPDTILGIEDN